MAVSDEVAATTEAGRSNTLASWAYPGAYDVDYGPGAPHASTGMIGDIYKYIAKISRPDVYITGADMENPDRECEYVSHSYFPDSGKICMFNVDFEKSHQVFLNER